MRPNENEYKPIFDYLGFGIDQAKTKDEIIKQFGFKDVRQLRAEVARERMLHCPIIVTPDGKYYNSYSLSDLNTCINGLLVKSNSIGQVARAMREITPDDDNDQETVAQIDIISYMASLEE